MSATLQRIALLFVLRTCGPVALAEDHGPKVQGGGAKRQQGRRIGHYNVAGPSQRVGSHRTAHEQGDAVGSSGGVGVTDGELRVGS